MDRLTVIPIGQYYPGESFLHRVDPRTKILFIVAYVILLFLVRHPLMIIGFSLPPLLAVIFSDIPLSYQWKAYRGILLMILLFGLFQMFYIREGFLLGKIFGLSLYSEGVKEAAFTALRLTDLLLLTSLLTFTTSSIALTEGLERLLSPFSRLGLPVGEIALMMTIAIRYIPTLLEEMEKIMKAQMARGADFESRNLRKRVNALFPLIVPLFVNSFRRAEELALSMEARGYRGGRGRTRRYTLTFTHRDGWVAFLLLLMGIALIGERVWLH
ncbi:Energy-coupling factor transporter transmembrane protein EcfT [[Clostridium] ultunense Esp]|uniref:energy-coupling factor transporter transmembrane component T family protein n=1 Tax=Thermicanus aegyptius TaxID=94009 RepID=UPI0002B6FB7F|nr:energy-coupling factor transporter transmembrane component T [Thermicanus aegyptius]CCQ93720.1 Energy-coupling factor transporter transmembrane protein EcfT [[Clostridium] ultunense Esp]